MDSAKRIAGFKRKHAKLLRIGPAPSEDKIARLSRQLWEFSERIRYSSLSRGIAAGAKR
jgi:hypothetical protein